MTPKGGTRTDLRLTRAPADTPRGRLHLAAMTGARAGRRAASLVPDDAARLRDLARRGVEHLRLDPSRGARLVVHVCHGLDRALAALAPLSEVDVPAICEELTGTLVQLEAREDQIARLTKELAFERSLNEQLRASLAAEQVRSAAALQDIPSDRFDEPTRNSNLSLEDMAALDRLLEIGGETVHGLGTVPRAHAGQRSPAGQPSPTGQRTPAGQPVPAGQRSPAAGPRGGAR